MNYPADREWIESEIVRVKWAQRIKNCKGIDLCGVDASFNKFFNSLSKHLALLTDEEIRSEYEQLCK